MFLMATGRATELSPPLENEKAPQADDLKGQKRSWWDSNPHTLVAPVFETEPRCTA